jgi:hypothetical protein
VFVCAAYEFARKCTSPISLLIPLLSIVWTSGLTNPRACKRSPWLHFREHRREGHPRGLFSHASAIACLKSTTDNAHLLFRSRRVASAWSRPVMQPPPFFYHVGNTRLEDSHPSSLQCMCCSDHPLVSAVCTTQRRPSVSVLGDRCQTIHILCCPVRRSRRTRSGSSAPLPTSPRSSPHRRPKESSMTDPPFPRVCRMGEISM